MRIQDTLLNSVVFVGYPSGEDGFQAVGTGFFIHHKTRRYLVTAQHIAAGLGEDPFGIRVNKFDGTSDVLLLDLANDTAKWFSDFDDPDVDLAALPFSIDLVGRGYDCREIASPWLATATVRDEWEIGIGDTCYAIGLFRLLAGTKRNLPVVHTGSIALMPGDERIPVRDWLAPVGSRARRHVEGYLVEMQNLRGLSGSPVLVRPSIVTSQRYTRVGTGMEPFHTRTYRDEPLLLGLWQASWDAPPVEVMAVEHGSEVRAPVGMGIVVPADKILRLLDSPALEEFRRRQAEGGAFDEAASPDSAPAP